MWEEDEDDEAYYLECVECNDEDQVGAVNTDAKFFLPQSDDEGDDEGILPGSDESGSSVHSSQSEAEESDDDGHEPGQSVSPMSPPPTTKKSNRANTSAASTDPWTESDPWKLRGGDPKK